MIGCTPVVDWRLIGAVAFGLFGFGVGYNALIHALGERKEGYTSLLVVAGVLITLGGVALIHWQAAALALLAFAASGLPMVVGDIGRHIWRREQAIERTQARAEEEAK